MRKLKTFAGALALIAALTCADARAQGFLSVYEDLPLAPGLTEAAGSGLSFDSPAGRIVEAYARGRVKAAEILSFYADVLPQLGWARISDAAFRREAETLRLDVKSENGVVVVHFTVAPE